MYTFIQNLANSLASPHSRIGFLEELSLDSIEPQIKEELRVEVIEIIYKHFKYIISWCMEIFSAIHLIQIFF